ncbi:MAG TPA: hypothetical protein VK961_19465 [Chthoniobacter sp.]|nr:hypothetical protein [Chthoniobacter sp.]
MSRSQLQTFACAAAALLAGCATTPPPLTSASPASPEAAEGARVPRQSSLRADDLTQKTAVLLSAARKEQQHWDAYGPVSGSPEEEPKDTTTQPNMKHDHQ